MDADRLKLLHGPYRAPHVKRGDRTTCLYRDCDVVVTGWSAARIPWPRCRALHQRGGSGLLVDEELKRAILTESAVALKHWFGVGTHGVWLWRRAFGVAKFGTDGSRRLHRAACGRGAAKVRGRPAPPRRKPNRDDLHDLLALSRAKRWEGQGWTAEQTALLGTMPDAEVAAKTGHSVIGVRVRRTRLGVATYRDGRRR